MKLRVAPLVFNEEKPFLFPVYPIHSNPDAAINCIVYYCNNGDNTR
jgi:hypothetical protein